MSRRIEVAEGELQSLLQRPLAETTSEQLTMLFAGGAKRLEDWLLGLEIEVIPHIDGEPAGYEPLKKTLEAFSANGEWEPEIDASGELVGLKGDGQIISLEPGLQVEYATRPYRALHDLRTAVKDVVASLASAAADQGVRFWALGHNPVADSATIPRTPKARYDIMRAYFTEQCPRSLEMMHLTGSVQCAVDFSDERNMVDKVRTAARVSPFLAALTASSPFSNGKPNGFKSIRYDIWLGSEPSRSGLWPQMVDEEGLTFRRYIEQALQAPAMLFVRGEQLILPEARPYHTYSQSGFQDSTVTVLDFVDHLTTMFPEIRTKSYIELRGADCAPPADAVAIAGFWRGLLDDEPTRLAVDDRLRTLDYAELRTLQTAVARVGLDATTSIGKVGDIAQWLVEQSYARMQRSAPDCAECLEPLVERAQRQRSLADDMLERAERDGLNAALELVSL